MRRWIVVLALLALPGCPGPGPGPQPTPTPPSPGGKYVEMLLRVAAPNQFMTIEGSPVDFMGAISCCMPNDWGGDAGWPVNIHPNWQDYAGEKFGANFFHARIGPFFGGTGPGVEPEWADVGGAYFTHPSGQADLTKWNDAYWARVKEWVEYAAERDRYVEVDVIDGWYCKHAEWGDVKTPWMAAYNVQGEQWSARCGKEEILPGTVFDNWIAKVVTELGPYGNVIWMDGNEIGLVQGYKPEWSISMRDRIRYYESELAYGVVHLYGTNSGNSMVRTQVDYIEEHTTAPLDAPLANRPSMVNEYNPRPPFSPTAMNDKRCFADANGTFWWYWRHEQSLEQMEQTAALYRQPCSGGTTCAIPGSNDEAWQPSPELDGQLWPAYRQALEMVGDRCGKPPDDTLRMVAEAMRSQGVCTSGPWADAVLGRRSDGLYEEWHAVAYGTGCTIPAVGAFKGTWKYAGTAPPPVTNCPVPDSCGEYFQLAAHQGVVDSTYTVTSCCAYCKSIGLGEFNGQIRCGCPVLPEGHPERPQRERDCIGVQRWWCNNVELARCGSGNENPNCITSNPAQAVCSGRAKTCTQDMRGCSEGDF